MVAKYDAANPDALKRLLAGGVKLQPFPRDHGGVLQSCDRGDDEFATKNAKFRRSTTRGRSSATTRTSGLRSPKAASTTS